MLNVAIVDDENKVKETLSKYLADYSAKKASSLR